MSKVVKRVWILLAVFINVFAIVSMQMAMPMFMPGIPQPVYAPMPIAIAIQLPDPTTKTTTTTTTTTTTPSSIAIAVPVPVPMPVQFAVPAHPPPIFCQGNLKPKSCPPCPPCICKPSCTPAFFSYCSPCHLKCRCRNSEDAPVPMPPHPPVPVPGPAYPMPVPVVPSVVAPPPVVIIPLPPSRPIPVPLPLPPKRRKKRRFPPFLMSSSGSDDSSSLHGSSISCDTDRYYRGGKKFKRRRTRIFRRNAGTASESSDLVKPIMSYISENGDVKFETKISSREALEILGEGKMRNSYKKHPMNVNANDKSIVVSSGGGKSGRRYNKILLRDSSNGHILKEGKNKLILKPPDHKEIKNLAVSFQIT